MKNQKIEKLKELLREGELIGLDTETYDNGFQESEEAEIVGLSFSDVRDLFYNAGQDDKVYLDVRRKAVKVLSAQFSERYGDCLDEEVEYFVETIILSWTGEKWAA